MPSRTFDMVATNSLEALESPLVLLPGMSPIITMTIGGTGTITNPTMKLFKGSKDVSATNLSGSMSVTGRAITCKQITSLSAGEWIFYVLYEDAGVPDERFCRFSVMKEGL